MRCPACNYNGTKVLDSRPVQDFGSIRRRRECESCGYRFTTFEMVEQTPLIIVKKMEHVTNSIGTKSCVD